MGVIDECLAQAKIRLHVVFSFFSFFSSFLSSFLPSVITRSVAQSDTCGTTCTLQPPHSKRGSRSRTARLCFSSCLVAPCDAGGDVSVRRGPRCPPPLYSQDLDHMPVYMRCDGRFVVTLLRSQYPMHLSLVFGRLYCTCQSFYSWCLFASSAANFNITHDTVFFVTRPTTALRAQLL